MNHPEAWRVRRLATWEHKVPVAQGYRPCQEAAAERIL